MKTDYLQRLNLAQGILVNCWEESKATDLADIMDALSSYIDQYNQDNSQFGVGA